MTTLRDALISECKTIAENCLYTAQAHFKIAGRTKGWHLGFVVVPALVVGFGAVFAALAPSVPALNQYQILINGIVAISGVLTAVAACVNFDKQSLEHAQEGKSFTALRHEARSLAETFAVSLSDQELQGRVEVLMGKYISLVQVTELTDEKAFLKVRDDVQAGYHEMDHLKAKNHVSSIAGPVGP
jgi:hypothetical protein